MQKMESQKGGSGSKLDMVRIKTDEMKKKIKKHFPKVDVNQAFYWKDLYDLLERAQALEDYDRAAKPWEKFAAQNQ